MHTNVILASLRVEVGSERVGATPFASAGFGWAGCVPVSAVTDRRPSGEVDLFSGLFPA